MMSFQRFWAMFRARNREFFRDRAAFGWNFLFPFLIVAGFAIIFSGSGVREYKIGVFPLPEGLPPVSRLELPERFRSIRAAEFVAFDSQDTGLDRLRHHQIDFLVQIGPAPHRYWVSDSSPKGDVVEQMFINSLLPPPTSLEAVRGEIQGRDFRYIDWLFPGILGMNMMFSALWGVGYVVVRYRKNGVLKRFKATPLTAFEYLSAQMVSRVFLLMFTLVVVWFGSDLIFSFRVEGSYLHIFLLFFLGSTSLTSLGLILAARGTSEEFTTGALNFISWPMMFLSEVWFSLEGAPQWVQQVSMAFPLTHLLTGVRKVMSDGAGLMECSVELAVLAAMTAAFLAIGAAMFSWTR